MKTSRPFLPSRRSSDCRFEFRTLVVLSIFGCLGLLANDATQTANVQAANIEAPLILNPGFEQSSDSSTLPDHWRGDRAVYRIDTEIFHGGKTSLRYDNGDPERYRLCVQSVPLTPGKKYRISAWVKTEKIEGKESGAGLCIEWCDADGKWLGGCYPTGVSKTSDWRPVEAIVRIPKEATNVTLKCYVRRSMTGTAWFDDLQVERLVDPPLATNLIAPAYRGRITAEGPSQICVRSQLNLTDFELKPSELKLAATLYDAQQAVKKTSSVVWDTDASDATAEVTLDAVDLPVGDYELTVALWDPSGEVLDTHRYAIHRVADDFRSTCFIDQHRRLIVEGKPFFPLGMYFGGIKEDELTTFADSRFNCLMAYGSPKEEQMDLIHSHGLKVIYSIKDFYAGSRWCPKSIKNEVDEERLIRERVQKHRNHPALLAWYLNDELPLSFLPQLEAHQRWVAEEDPNHPTWVVLYQYKQVAQYLRTFDVIGTDPYPIGSKSASEAGVWTEEVIRQVDNARAIWQVPQVFNWANYREHWKDADKFRSPTTAEIRSMSWQCICEGANGLVYYSFYDLKRNKDVAFDESWPALKGIVAEIDRFAPMLLSVEPVPEIDVKLTETKTEGSAAVQAKPSWLHWLARQHRGKLYLVATNDGDGEGHVEFVLPSKPAAVRTVSDGGETQAIEIGSQGFATAMKPLEVQVFEVELAR